MTTRRPARSRLVGIFRFLSATTLLLITTACTTPAAPQFCRTPPPGTETIYVVSHGWHTEVGIIADNLRGPLAIYRGIFPGARAIMFGYGKRTFMTAPPDSFSEYFLGPLPGTAVIQVTGLTVSPSEAYLPGETIALSLPPDGGAALSRFIWNDLGKDKTGAPRLIGPATFPGSLFYAAQSRYNLFHTCNTWTVDALVASGLPTSSGTVVFSGQAMARAEMVAAGQCAPTGSKTASLGTR